MKLAVALIALFAVLPMTSMAEDVVFPKIMNHATLMRLSPAKRAKYLNTLAELINKFETDTQHKATSEDHAMLQQFKELIAQEIAFVPEARAEREDPEDTTAITPIWVNGAWTCKSTDQSVEFNDSVGSCIRKEGRGGDCGSMYKGDVKVYVRKTLSNGDVTLGSGLCVPAQSWAALSDQRRKDLSAKMGAESVADKFKTDAPLGNLTQRALLKNYYLKNAMDKHASDLASRDEATKKKAMLAANMEASQALRAYDADPAGKAADVAAARTQAMREQTKSIVAGNLTPMQQNQIAAGNTLNSQNPAVAEKLVPPQSKDQTAGADVPAAATKCVPKTCPSTPADIKAARNKYKASHAGDAAGPACIIGGQFSAYQGPPADKGCKGIQKWNGDQICKKANGVSQYRQTVCNPVLWCKKNKEGKPAPFCLPVTQTVSAQCEAAADAKGPDCAEIPGVAGAHDEFVQKVQDQCGKDQDFKGLFCNECASLAKGIAKANLEATEISACDPNDPANKVDKGGNPAPGNSDTKSTQ